MKRCLTLLLALLLLPLTAPAEQPILNRLNNLTEEYRFPADTPLLEVVFPRMIASDCAILRLGEEVWLIDVSTGDDRMHRRITSALHSMGVDHIDAVFNSHPDPDHLGGFVRLAEEMPVGELILTFETDYNDCTAEAAAFCESRGIPLRRARDGDLLAMGPEGEVSMRVFQRNDNGKWGANNRSAMLLVTFGERTILFAGDVENHAQASFGDRVPEGGLHADILKYPHHGKVKLNNHFFAAIDPAFAIQTGASGTMDGGRAYLRRKGVDYVVAYHGLTRMRTDGSLWVVDYLHETDPDRETKNPAYR